MRYSPFKEAFCGIPHNQVKHGIAAVCQNLLQLRICPLHWARVYSGCERNKLLICCPSRKYIYSIYSIYIFELYIYPAENNRFVQTVFNMEVRRVMFVLNKSAYSLPFQCRENPREQLEKTLFIHALQIKCRSESNINIWFRFIYSQK